MKFPKAIAVLLVFASLHAHATDIITPLNSIPVPSSISYANTHVSSEFNTTFWDDFTFTLTGAEANSITSSISLGSFYGLSNLKARLYSGSTHQIVSSALLPAGIVLQEDWGTSVSLPGGVSQSTTVLNPVALTAGTYTLQIKGLVTGSNGGSYAGVLNVMPVPEPETYSMFFAGLMLLGVSRGNRKNNF